MMLAKLKTKSIWLVAIVFAAFFALSFCGNLFAFAQNEQTDKLEDFSDFQSSLFDMFEKYDQQEEEISAFSLNDQAEEQQKINRLIVKSEDKLSSFGAVASAKFNDLQIFQYESAQDANFAFQQFSNSNITVSYDAITTIETFETQTEFNLPQQSAKETNLQQSISAKVWENKTFRSWGASHVGYLPYVQNMTRKTTPVEVIVAVLDSGINTAHELFTDRLLLSRGRDFTGEDVSSSYKFQDLNGHGTHVSGTIAESTLDNVKILPLKVLKGNGKGTVSMIVSALEYVKTLKEEYSKTGNGLDVKVLNMSIGIESRNGEIANNPTLEKAVLDVYKVGVVPVVSAGNDRLNTSYACPANVQEAIVVSALYEDVYGNVAFDESYSNFGSHVDFSAPGTSIVSAGIASKRSYVRMSGTSMAAPHVTACVALIYSDPKFADYGVEAVHKLLKENATDLGADGWDEFYGWGCVNVTTVGVTYSGYVNFSVTEEFHTQEFSLSLQYDEPGVDATIYYTFSETAKTADATNGFVYTAPIKIHQTTKVTAVAYFNNVTDDVSQSYASSQVYYFNNVDLLSNYQFDEADEGTIVKYNGKLTELNVPFSNHGALVDTIAENAFNGSAVQILNLPSSITRISQNAFEGNTILQEIHCKGFVQIESYAFYKCSNLRVFNLPNISSVGIYAFSYCTSLPQLQLYAATSVGRHAFSGSGIKKVYFGSNLQSVGEQRNCALDTVYGYSSTEEGETSAAEALALAQGAEFYDLTLRFSKDLNETMVVRSGITLQLQVKFVGRECKFNVYGSQTLKIEKLENQKDGFENTLTINLSPLSVGKYQLYLEISDSSSSAPVKSQTLQIDAVGNNLQTFEISFNLNGNYDVYVNEQLIETKQVFYKALEYDIKIVPKDGFVLRRVAVNGTLIEQLQPMLCQFKVEKNSQDLQIDVEAVPKNVLQVVFETKDKGVIYVDNETVETQNVLRENSLSFVVAAKEGFFVKRVMANGKVLLPSLDGIYTIENILKDVVVDVAFEEQYNNVMVVCGKGGNVSTTGDVTSSDLAFGSSRVYTISTNDGYAIDYVSINGQKVEVVGNSFMVQNLSKSVDEVISVVISFKKANASLFSKDSIVFVYFIIFLAIFVIFVLATIILQIVRKKKKKDGKIHKYFY